jgi:hypothetical protein
MDAMSTTKCTTSSTNSPTRKVKAMKQPMILDKSAYVTAHAAGRLTPYSAQTWANWAAKGVISHLRIGKKILIPKSEIERLIAQGTRPAVAQVEARG